MTDDLIDSKAQALRGHAVEQAAVEWILGYERANGRSPVDRRYKKSFAGDIESPPRIIEIKATATSYRGWFLPLEPVQVEHARTDANFFLYVVENVGQGDPRQFTLRIISGDLLRELAAKAVERRYFEMSWPTKVYDSIAPIGWSPDDSAETSVIQALTMNEPVAAAGLSTAISVATAIREALEAMGGEGTVAQVAEWIKIRYPGRWKDVGVPMADLTFPGNLSSTYRVDQRFLERTAPGRYRLRG
jgi:hypothetical protein